MERTACRTDHHRLKKELQRATQYGLWDVAREQLILGVNTRLCARSDGAPYLHGEALALACRRGPPDLIRLFLLSGARPDDVSGLDLSVPSFEAAKFGNPRALSILLEHGADPELRNNRGDSLWHMAAIDASGACAMLLFERGVPGVGQPNSEGMHPVWFAAINGNHRALASLVTAGADPMSLNPRGRNIAHAAAKASCDPEDAVETLSLAASMGVCMDLPDLLGLTPLDMSHGQVREALSSILESSLLDESLPGPSRGKDIPPPRL